MKIFKHITDGLSVAILVTCCGALLIFGWSATGWKALSIPTGSMRPTLPPGSLVLVHSVPISALKIGDVITYINPLNPKTTISHRIVKEYFLDGKIPAFVTKGDANRTNDIPITEGSVQGKVVWHIPNVGYWLIDAKKPIVILPIIYFAAILLMAEEVKRLSDYLKLSQPYRLLGYVKYKRQQSRLGKRLAYGTGATIMATLMIGVALTPSALALLTSNTVALVNNNLTVAPITQCSSNTNNKTSIIVNNNSNQSGQSGDSKVNDNTNSGSAGSGSVSNSNTSTMTINIKNC